MDQQHDQAFAVTNKLNYVGERRLRIWQKVSHGDEVLLPTARCHPLEKGEKARLIPVSKAFPRREGILHKRLFRNFARI